MEWQISLKLPQISSRGGGASPSPLHGYATDWNVWQGEITNKIRRHEATHRDAGLIVFRDAGKTFTTFLIVTSQF